MGRNNNFTRRTGFKDLKYGRFLILTNGEKTEINYFNGFKNSLPQEMQDNIQISVLHCELDNLEYEIQRKKAKAQYSKTYIVLDKDRETDKTLQKVKNTAKRNNCHIIFSAPCIEYWFLKHFNTTVTFQENMHLPASQQCIKELEKYIKHYNKNDDNIYNILNKIGSENTAIELAKKEFKPYKNKALYEINNATNVYELIEEIKYHKH